MPFETFAQFLLVCLGVAVVIPAGVLGLAVLAGAAQGLWRLVRARRELPAVRAELAALEARDRVVRPFAAALARVLAEPPHPARVLYNPKMPALQVHLRSAAHPVVVVVLDRATGVPVGAMAADGPAVARRYADADPEVFTRAERRLLADLVAPHLVEVAAPPTADRILAGLEEDAAAGPLELEPYSEEDDA